jgi:DNA (cytosine-5)-methyltransferase 1
MNAQVNMLTKKIVDNFACGGGASTGIELALGRPVDIAVNHDREAIAMHEKNHPFTKHYREDVFTIDPKTAVEGCPVELAWFSPDCTHHSRARGGKPVEKKIRGLAWVAIKWAMEVRPEVIMLENVKEIQTWGPLMQNTKGEWIPDPERKCETFQGFIRMLSTGIEPDHPALLEACEFLKIDPVGEKAKMLIQGLGYDVEFNELKGCNFGAATIRERFFMITRCDGRKIVWPKPTHGKPGSGLLPYKTAAEIIDWTLPIPSIFESKEYIKEKHGITAVRPLADATMKRISRGIKKHVIDSPDPYIVPWTVSNVTNATGHKVSNPVDTIRTGGGGGQMFLAPTMTAIGQTGFSDDRSYGIEEPIRTVVSKAEQCLIAPTLIQYHSETSDKESRGQAIDEPLMTVDAANRYGLASVFMSEYYGNAQDGISAKEPMHTITGKDREGVTAAFMSKYYGGYQEAGNSVKDPLNTITSWDHNALAMAYMSKFYKTGIGQDLNEPLHTITTSPGHFGVIEVKLVKAEPGQDLYHWPEIRAMLNEFCGYSLKDDEVLIFKVRGIWYFISDIGLRMLTPRELYNAQGFPADYIIELEYNGKPYSKAKQVSNVGNSVCPVLPYVLVKANLPYSCCKRKLTTMRDLENEISV